MATIKVDEGQVGEALGDNTLEYPNINSCLSLTAVYADKKRYGGHAVMLDLQPGQLTLQQICDKINANKGTSTRLIIIGDIGTWNQHWGILDQTKNLVLNGKKVTSVGDIGVKMGFATTDEYDTDNCATPGGSYDVYFGYISGARKFWVYDTKTKLDCPYIGQKTW
ncbi:hypothetical protein [Chitinophaga sp. HK235]|uniref:hypothetical protein n=1 Tax=Chitinophaga sp. HK235 TaxID=2952571 RepID=UPI001BAAA9F4|nr:hypothetical protein [Chitinophaga sp. HK235]